MEAYVQVVQSNSPLKDEELRILVVEDEQEIRDLISLHLLRQNFKVKDVATAEEALELLQSQHYHMIVLDWMLPGFSGMDLLKSLRQRHQNIPVLMVTARVAPQDIVEGLESGADDYLSKPFDPGVLVARVRALLRRIEAPSQENVDLQRIVVGDLVVELGSYEVQCSGEKLHLTPSEFKLLATMVQNLGKVLTRDQLIQEVQGEGISVVGRTVDTHIFGLRKKLGPCSDFIETIRGVGYRIKPVA